MMNSKKDKYFLYVFFILILIILFSSAYSSYVPKLKDLVFEFIEYSLSAGKESTHKIILQRVKQLDSKYKKSLFDLLSSRYSGFLWYLFSKTAIRKKISWNGQDVRSLSFNPDSFQMLTGKDNGSIYLKDFKSEITKAWKAHSDVVTTLSFFNNYPLVLTASDDKTLKIWDLEKNFCLKTIENKHSISTASISENGQYVVFANDNGLIFCWSFLYDKLLYVIPGHLAAVNFIIVSPCGNYIFSSSQDKTSKLWYVQGGVLQLLWTLNSVSIAIFSKSQNYIFVTDINGRNYMLEYQPDKVFLINHFTTSEVIADFKFFSDSNTILYSSGQRAYVLYLPNSSSKLISSHDDQVKRVYISSNGLNLITISKNTIEIASLSSCINDLTLESLLFILMLKSCSKSVNLSCNIWKEIYENISHEKRDQLQLEYEINFV